MKGWFSRFGWLQFAATVALVVLGVMSICSAGGARPEPVFHEMWKSTLNTSVVGFAVYLLLAFTDYRRWLAPLALPSYVAALALLVAVLVFGDMIYGGRRWLWFFQPSEISKLCIILFVAWLFGETGPGLRGFRGFLVGAAVIGLPCLLILKEPDLGTALVLAPTALVMLFATGVWWRGLLTLTVVGLVAASALLVAVSAAERPGTPPERREAILRFVPLRPHQLQRVRTFLYPETDIRGAGWTLRQSMIAIGSGGVSGKGFRRGETNRLRFLPPSVSMNDFIFCVYAEERGYVGTLMLLALFAVICLGGAWTALRAADLAGRLLALGVSTLIFAHVFVNIAMSVGLVPITGLPLPLISSGRTFLVTALAGLGIIQSVSIHSRGEPLQ